MKLSIVLFALMTGMTAAHEAQAATKHQDIELQVTEKGFEPSQIDVRPGTTVTLKVTRKTDSTCATVLQVPARMIKKDLPLNKTITVNLGELEKGEIRFACGMDMVSGQIIVR